MSDPCDLLADLVECSVCGYDADCADCIGETDLVDLVDLVDSPTNEDCNDGGDLSSGRLV